jgi:aerobic C4-dicarboxylate transport protein
MSSVALLIGMVVGNLVQPGAGLNADPAKLDIGAVAQYAKTAHTQSVAAFLVDIVPNTIVEAFAGGNILPIVFVSILLGYVLARMGERGKPIRDLLDLGSKWIFGCINVIMRAAPLGAFGAMAFTIGHYGVGSLKSLVALVATFYLCAGLFVVIVLGAIGWYCGFSIFKLLAFIKEEILIVLGTSSSDAALPTLMEKLQRLGCSRSIVGLVAPTGYVFNTDGTNLYMTMAVLFVAQATNIHLTLMHQLAIFGVACLTSKGSAGVPGAGFVALVGTIAVIPSVPLAGIALILGIDRTISEGRALVNVIGNAVATIVVAKWEGELDRTRMRHALNPAGAD